MTPKKFIDLVRWRGNINTSSPWADADLLPNVLHTIDDMAQAIMQVNPDYFEETSTANSIADQQEYTKPTDLALLKRLDVSFTDTLPGSYKPARQKTLAQLSDQGEDWYAANQPQSNPLFRFADTGLFLYPKPTTGHTGVAFLRLWYVPTRPDLANLTEDTIDIETTTGIGQIFHEPMVDMMVNHIKAKKGDITALDVKKLNDQIKDMIDPSAYRTLSTFTGDLPSDTHLQI